MKTFSRAKTAVLALALAGLSSAASAAGPCPFGMTLTHSTIGTPRCIGVPIQGSPGGYTAGGIAYQGLQGATPSPTVIGGGSPVMLPPVGYSPNAARATAAADWNPNAGQSDLTATTQGFVANVPLSTGNEVTDFINWQMRQPNPFGSGTLGDMFVARGIDPYGAENMITVNAGIENYNRRQALSADRGMPASLLKPWSVDAQALQADVDARVAARDQTNAAACAASSTCSSISAGPGPAPSYAPGPSSQSVSASINQELASIQGGGQPALDKWLASSKYTPEQMAAASGYEVGDIVRAITNAKNNLGLGRAF